jgi:predicted glycoside hydrolase/deacetylase ChbG (UPF0249 family)
MSIQLIVNADDYGRTPGVSSGIRTAHLEGIVTSTTVMMNMPDVESDLEIVQKECPDLGVGVHLVLTAGMPILPVQEVPTLLDRQGHFPSAPGFLDLLAGIDPAQVRYEWEAQIQKFIRLTGKKPDHLDSHHHTSYFTTNLFMIMLELANELDCAIRPPLAEAGSDLPLDLPAELAGQNMDFIPSLLMRFKPRHPENFFSSFYDQAATLEKMMTILSNLPAGTSEVMCHPGFTDPDLKKTSSYNLQRETELGILKDPGLKTFIREHGIQLIPFSCLS